jgi:hypothetical protein
MATRFRPHNTKKVMIAVSDLFNDIKIETRDGDLVNIPLFIGSTEKYFQMKSKDGKGRAIAQALPAIGINLTSIDLDEDRVMNPINKIIYGNKYVLQPVPYNFGIDVYIIAKLESELMDIIESIVPYYQKGRAYPLIDFKFNDDTCIQRDLMVEMSSSSIDIASIDVAESDEQKFSATLTMLAKGWIYGWNSSLDAQDTKYYISLQNSNLNKQPDNQLAYWEEMPLWKSSQSYGVDSYVRYEGSIYKSTITDNLYTPSTLNGWTFVIEEKSINNWKNSVTYSIDNYSAYPGVGIIQHIDIDFNNEYNRRYETLSLEYNNSGVLEKTVT